MRTYSRVYDAEGQNPVWEEVDTDANGFDDAVWITTLVQCLRLNLGESPFYANFGIPAQQSVVTQIMPDYYVYQTQSQFGFRFASLLIVRAANRPPTYNVFVTTHQGAKVELSSITQNKFKLDYSTLNNAVLG